MSNRGDRGPRPADQLFKNVFANRSSTEVYKLVADGISGAWRNAERLLSDANLLVEAGRLSSATFMITTAREELAKASLLVDACMLDLSRHETALRKLCQAFYDHVAKHAYVELLEETLTDSMEKAGGFWDVAVKRWWPGNDFESGEPDMPHATYFEREFPLYLDYSDYDRCWLIPNDASQKFRFRPPQELFSKTEQLVGVCRKADADGLFSPHVLGIINSVFKNTYVKDDTANAELERIFASVEKRVVAEAGILAEAFRVSPLVRWPLYHFVARGW